MASNGRRQCDTHETIYSTNFLLYNQSKHATFPTPLVDHDNTQHPPTPYINPPHRSLNGSSDLFVASSFVRIVVFNDQSSRFFWIYSSLKPSKVPVLSSRFHFSHFHVVIWVRVSSKPEIFDLKFVLLYLFSVLLFLKQN